jgi:hypothetical protein
MNTPELPAVPAAAAEPAPDGDAARENFNPTHPKLYLFHEGEERVDGLSIDPAPLPVLGTDASRGLG